MQRRLYIDEAHTALDIFRFAEFFLKGYWSIVLYIKGCQKNPIFNKNHHLFHHPNLLYQSILHKGGLTYVVLEPIKSGFETKNWPALSEAPSKWWLEYNYKEALGLPQVCNY